MADNTTTRVVNLTPLTFDNQSGFVLQPFQQVQCPSGRIGLLDIKCGLLNVVEVHGDEFMIVPELLMKERGVIPSINAPYLALEVQNNTGRYVSAYRWSSQSKAFDRPQLIPAGKSWLFNGQGEVWFFRATFTDELVGIVRMGAPLQFQPGVVPEQTLRVTLTDEYVQRWRKHQDGALKTGLQPEHPNGTAAPNLSPRRVIGEKRKKTPPKDDQTFLTATDVSKEFSTEIFNGRKNRVLRDVEIAGVLLRWGGSNPTLADFYGEDKDDIRSLTIYADRMEVADHLRFPRTNVTIYARELAFISEGSSIDTTPLANAVPARSQFFTGDPDDPTSANLPADKSGGSPTYVAANGEQGEQGGTITLYVREVIDTAGTSGTKRFVCRGGKGQAAEAGGLKRYVPKEGYPATYGKSQTFTVHDVKNLLESNSSERTRGDRWAWRSDYWRWPGGEVWPNQMGFAKPEENPLNNGTAVKVKLKAFSDSVLYAAYLERGFLPGGKYEHWGGKDGVGFKDGTFETRYKDEPNPAPRPCDGRDAYPGGWPGDGGNGGLVNFHLETGALPDSTCDVGPGEPGDPTAKVEGAKAPGPTPAYDLTIEIVLKSLAESSRQPTFTPTDVTGKPGNSAKARKIVHGAEAAPSDCEVTGSTAQNGRIERKPAGSLSWAEPNLVSAVLRYARTAFRNGFRDEAAAALDPYYALIGPDGSANSTDGRLRLALASVRTMRDNLIRNLDYYGNPPGWVPRLNALSNLHVMNAVRQTAYEMFYFSDKLLRDYDSLDNAHAISRRTSEALKNELDDAKENLRKAYESIPEALRELDKAQSDLEPIKKDIVDLQDLALKKTKDEVTAQRIYSSAMQILGGIAKSLPVGQPFVGLAGSAFEAASQIDWNAEDPLKTARSAISSFSNDVTESMKDPAKKNQLTRLVTKDLTRSGSEQDDLVTQLSRSLEDETKEPEKKAEAIEKNWKEFKVEERKTLAAEAEEAKSVVSAIDSQLAALRAKISTLTNDPTKKEDLKKSEQEQKEYENAKKAAQETVNKLKAEVASLEDEKIERLTALADYARRQAETEQDARRLLEAAKPEFQKQAETLRTNAAERKTKLDNLNTKIKEAKRTSEDQKKLIKKREETVKDVMSNLEGLGKGLSLIGNGIVSLATPLTPADPTWQRLAAQMLHDDPELQTRSKQLEQKMREMLELKRRRVDNLLRWQHVAGASIAVITNNLGTLTELSRQRQSIDQGLNPALRGYLEETKARAKDILGESIYWFVKSYQYEFLADVEDSFFNFDTWAEEIKKLESAKAKAKNSGSTPTPTPTPIPIPTPIPTPTPTSTGAAVATGTVPAAKVEAIVLSESEFTQIGEGVFKAETYKLGFDLLTTRQARGERFKGDYKSCVLERSDSSVANKKQLWMNKMLDDLLKKKEISFSFVSDFEKGSFDLYDARVNGLELTAFEITTKDPNLTFTVRVVHSGQSLIAKRSDDGREFLAFQTGRRDQPIAWQWIYNNSAPVTPVDERLKASSTEDTVAENVKVLFDQRLANCKFKDYNPGLFSDFILKIIDLDEVKQSKITAINKVVMNLNISQGE